MKSHFIPKRYDLYIVLTILICSPLFALLQDYDSDQLFGSIPMALLVGIPLGALFVFPVTLYLLVKYTVILFKVKPLHSVHMHVKHVAHPAA